jgi:hypothetical protein
VRGRQEPPLIDAPIANGFMPNGKEVVSYAVGDWTFESCAEVDPEE